MSAKTADVEAPVLMMAFAARSKIELNADMLGILAAALGFERPEFTTMVHGEAGLPIGEEDGSNGVCSE